MSKTSFKASAQGSLDGLCGIYAIINACDLLLGNTLNYDDRAGLFCKLTTLLDDGRPIGDIIHDGIGFRKLGELIDVASRTLALDHAVAIRRKVASKSSAGELEDFWEELRQNVDSAAGRVALLGVGGKHNHWTVVEQVSDKSLTLADSDGLKRFNKSDCDVKEDSKTHHLWPTQTYFLWRAEVETTE